MNIKAAALKKILEFGSAPISKCVTAHGNASQGIFIIIIPTSSKCMELQGL